MIKISRDGQATIISLGLHPTKVAQFFCHKCRTRFIGHLEFSRLKVLNENGSCFTQRTYCKECTPTKLLDPESYEGEPIKTVYLDKNGEIINTVVTYRKQ